MITRGDDYPVHQTAKPVAFSANPTDRNHYERFFFDGYTRDGSWFFAVAAAVYPNRGVMDAAVSVVHDGVQTNVRASRRMPADFLEIDVGPINVRVVEPLQKLAVTLAPNESGTAAELEFVARGPAVEEGPYTSSIAGLELLHYMRFTQHGGYSGRVTSGGATVELDPSSAWGCRDRSWGSRPVGEGDPNAGAQMMRLVQTFGMRSRDPVMFLWAPLNFPEHVVLWTLSRGISDAYDAASIAAAKPDAEPAHTNRIGHRLVMRETSNHLASGVLQFQDHEIELTPLYDFSMSGIGYGHPEWGHGRWRSELDVGFDAFNVSDIDRKDRAHAHVQTVCRCVLDKTDEGIGVLEQILASYEPRPLQG